MEKLNYSSFEEKELSTAEEIRLSDNYINGLLSPSIFQLCGIREADKITISEDCNFEQKIAEWQSLHPERYVIVFGNSYQLRDTIISSEDIKEFFRHSSYFYVVDRQEKRVKKYTAQNWHDASNIYIPYNKHNLRRVYRAIYIAASKENRKVSPKKCVQIFDNNIFLDTHYIRVNRIAQRLLIHDWQAGRLQDIEPMEYPVVIYFRYYGYDGHLGSETGYLYPDGSFTKAGGCGVQYLPVANPNGGNGAYVDTSYGEAPNETVNLVC